jgi:alkylated DNA repair dioxygenase AlkB
MRNILDLDRYPLDKEGSLEWNAMVAKAVAELDAQGMFNLEGFVRPDAVRELVAHIKPVMDTESYTHKRLHNIYFQPEIPGLEPEHPALRKVETINHTLCADQSADSMVLSIYQYPPFARFLAATVGKPQLHVMQDPLASVNVMAYRTGEALNWHFDRSEFTTTLLLLIPTFSVSAFIK